MPRAVDDLHVPRGCVHHPVPSLGRVARTAAADDMPAREPGKGTAPVSGQDPAMPAEPDEELQGTVLQEHIMGGLTWVSAASAVVELASAGTTVVIARLVTPGQYGRAVIALIVPVLASILTYEGFGTPLVLRRKVDRTDLQVATGVSLGLGVLLCGLVVLFAQTAAGPVFGHRMVGLFEMTAPAFVIYAAAVVPRAVLSRRLHWRLMNGSDAGGAIVTGLVSTVLALLGLGASAIVLGAMAGGAVTTLLLWVGAPPVMPRWERHRARESLRVGASAAGAGVAMTFRRNIDYIMLATRLPAHRVGLYWRGFSLGVDQQSKISGVTTRVAMSILPRTDRDDDLRSARRALVQLNTLVIFPLLGILVATAPWFVPAVYGHRWAGAVVPTQVLAIGGMVWATLAGMEGALFAAGAAGALALFNLISLVTVGAVAYLVAPMGVVAVAIAMVALELGTLGCAQYFLLYKRVKVRPRDATMDVLPATVATALMVLVVAPVASRLATAVPPLLVVALSGALGLGIYALIVRRLFPSSWSMLQLLLATVGIPPLLRRRRAPVAPPGPDAAERRGWPTTAVLPSEVDRRRYMMSGQEVLSAIVEGER